MSFDSSWLKKKLFTVASTIEALLKVNGTTICGSGSKLITSFIGGGRSSYIHDVDQDKDQNKRPGLEHGALLP